MTLEQDQIQNIIDGCLQQDRKAQELLYRSFYRAMITLCLRYTKNEEDALEVLNTGFYKVYKSLATYNSSKSSLYTWIRTIIINSCLDFIRKQQKGVLHQQLDQAAEVHLSPEVFGNIQATEILTLVRQLPPATQAVFNLYVMEGFNHKEIAQLLGISEGTSKWHLSEARKTLQSLIKKRDVV